MQSSTSKCGICCHIEWYVHSYCFIVPISGMAEQGQARLAPSGSGIGNRARGQRRRVRRRMTYSRGREVIRNDVSRTMQNVLRDARAIRREREKKFRELRASLADQIEHYQFTRNALIDAIGEIELYDWEALAILVDSLGEPLGSILTDIYHEIWPSESFWVYILKFEAEWENRLYNYL